jgi:diacylglycerol kinase family enzyme
MTACHGAVPVIVSPGSGRGHDDAGTQRIVAAFEAAGLSVALHSPEAGEDLGALAARVMRDNPPVMIGGGGDGTISAVAAELVGTDTALGVLPLGTLNHFAKDLAIPLDLDGAARVIASGHRVAVDVGDVNGRVFVNNSSLGLYPDMVRDRERQRQRLGRGKWAALAWASITMLRRYPFLDVAMSIHGHSHGRRTAFVFIGNNEYVMEGFDIGSRPRLNGGILSVYVTQRCGRAGLFLLALRALVGRIRQVRDLDALTCHTVTIESRHRRLRVANDGEVVVMETPLRYRVRSGALTVLAAVPDPEAHTSGAPS